MGLILTWALVGGIVVGFVGFAVGFVGPLVFAPAANQGPLVGILITGPLGLVLGAIGGAIYGARQLRKARRG